MQWRPGPEERCTLGEAPAAIDRGLGREHDDERDQRNRAGQKTGKPRHVASLGPRRMKPDSQGTSRAFFI
jgi:hypothetical protein